MIYFEKTKTSALPENPSDRQFLSQATAVVQSNMSNAEFGVEALANKMGVSRRQLYRKLKTLTGQSAGGFIRDSRLQKAAQLLVEGGQAVTDIALAVGFGNLSYFCRCFQQKFGVKPSEYVGNP